MLSCRKATELMEKKLHFKLSPVEKIQLYLHTRMCDACNAYQKQNEAMDLALHKHLSQAGKIETPSKVTLSDDFKKSLVKNLQKK